MYEVCIGVSEQALGWFPTFGDNNVHAFDDFFSCIVFCCHYRTCWRVVLMTLAQTSATRSRYISYSSYSTSGNECGKRE